MTFVISTIGCIITEKGNIETKTILQCEGIDQAIGYLKEMKDNDKDLELGFNSLGEIVLSKNINGRQYTYFLSIDEYSSQEES